MDKQIKQSKGRRIKKEKEIIDVYHVGRKFRIYPILEQRKKLDHYFRVRNFIWNRIIDLNHYNYQCKNLRKVLKIEELSTLKNNNNHRKNLIINLDYQDKYRLDFNEISRQLTLLLNNIKQDVDNKNNKENIKQKNGYQYENNKVRFHTNNDQFNDKNQDQNKNNNLTVYKGLKLLNYNEDKIKSNADNNNINKDLNLYLYQPNNINVQIKDLSYIDLKTLLYEVKGYSNQDLLWLLSVPRTVLTATLKDLEKSFKNFFKNPKHYAFPKKKKSFSYKSIGLQHDLRSQGKLKAWQRDKSLLLIGIGNIKIQYSKSSKAQYNHYLNHKNNISNNNLFQDSYENLSPPSSVTISKKSNGKYYISFMNEVKINQNTYSSLGLRREKIKPAMLEELILNEINKAKKQVLNKDKNKNQFKDLNINNLDGIKSESNIYTSSFFKGLNIKTINKNFINDNDVRVCFNSNYHNNENKSKNYVCIDKENVNIKTNLVKLEDFKEKVEYKLKAEIGNKWLLGLNPEQRKDFFIHFKNNLLNNKELVGFDLDTKQLLFASDGKCFTNNKSYYKYQRYLKKQQKILSRRKKGSNRYQKQKLKVSKIHEKITNIRNDTIHKMTHSILNTNNMDNANIKKNLNCLIDSNNNGNDIKNADKKPKALPNYGEAKIICMETLKIKNMVKNKKLSKVLYDSSFGEIIRQLEYKAEKQGKILIKIDQYFASSKTCSCCGYKNKDLKLNERKWGCGMCNQEHHRDHNAAKNIKLEGLRQYALLHHLDEDVQKLLTFLDINDVGIKEKLYLNKKDIKCRFNKKKVKISNKKVNIKIKNSKNKKINKKDVNNEIKEKEVATWGTGVDMETDNHFELKQQQFEAVERVQGQEIKKALDKEVLFNLNAKSHI